LRIFTPSGHRFSSQWATILTPWATVLSEAGQHYGGYLADMRKA